MRDWRRFVSVRLGRTGLPPDLEDEVVTELADHLEDCSEHVDGNDPEREAAVAAAVKADWAALKHEIIEAKAGEGEMNQRTKSVLLPGLAMLFLYAYILRLVIQAGLEPRIVWVGQRVPMLNYTGLPLTLYIPWLVALPLIGALGAWWSRQLGGGRWERLLAGLFPIVSLLALLAISLLLSFVIDPHVPIEVKFAALAMYLFSWVIIPGAGLLLGTLLLLRNFSATNPAQ
jgi:hypothetical protein